MAHPPILAPFLQKALLGGTVRLINTYRGVPIASEATVLAQGDHFLKLSVSKYQAVCLEITRQTYIKCTRSPVLSANVVDMNLAKETTVLSDFCLADQNIDGRNAIRVEPKEPVQLILWGADPEKYCIAELADISTSGLGIYVISIRLGAQYSISDGGEINVRMKLPAVQQGIENLVTLHGRVTYNLYAMDYPYLRLGLNLLPDAEANLLISQYVAERQREIVREVKLLYTLLRQLDVTGKA
jgi:hypothetical protein